MTDTSMIQPPIDNRSQCPCGSLIEYLNCCGLFHNAEQLPATPEALMRSRYSAYALANIDYIKKTMKGKPLIGFNESEVRDHAKSVKWIGLKIIESKEASPDLGYVEFIASFLEHGKQRSIHEISEFHRIQGKWFYVDGITPRTETKSISKKIGRNSSCPCGSQKKFKNCHGKKIMHSE